MIAWNNLCQQMLVFDECNINSNNLFHEMYYLLAPLYSWNDNRNIVNCKNNSLQQMLDHEMAT